MSSEARSNAGYGSAAAGVGLFESGCRIVDFLFLVECLFQDSDRHEHSPSLVRQSPMTGGPFGFLALVDLMSREFVLFEEVELLPDDIMVPTGVSVEVVLLDFIVFECFRKKITLQ